MAVDGAVVDRASVIDSRLMKNRVPSHSFKWMPKSVMCYGWIVGDRIRAWRCSTSLTVHWGDGYQRTRNE